MGIFDNTAKMIIAFIGDIGSGKTISMIKYAYEEYLKGRIIYTNIWLDFPKTKGHGKIVDLDMQFFIDYAKSDFNIQNALVLIDEIHIYFDSRNPMTKRNKIFSKFITQSRKRSVTLVYTTQDENPLTFRMSGQVDLRVRKLTDRVVLCKLIKVGKKEFIHQEFHSINGTLLTKEIVYANPYFHLYDTNQIISFDDLDEALKAQEND